MANSNLPPLRILSLDGGGVRGLSSLMILQDVMNTISQQERASNIRPKQDDTPLKPCEYFDIIGGTSTGGIIAILLSRLRLDVPTCIGIYTRLAEEIFSKDHSIRVFGAPLRFGRTRFSGAVLEKAIKRVLVENGFDPEEKMFDESLLLEEKERQRRQDTDQLARLEVTHSGTVRDVDDKTRASPIMCDRTPLPNQLPAKPSNTKHGCLGIVVAGYEHAIGFPKLFKTNDLTDRTTKIWQALRATSAAPTFFEEITFGAPKITYIDGGLGYNSPCAEIDFEAKSLWPGREIGVIVSIGTGLQTVPAVKRGVIRLPFGLQHELSLATAVLSMATSTTRVDNEVQRMYQDTQTEYYRWDVDSGLGDISLEQWMKEDEMGSLTRRYMDDPDQVIRKQKLAGAIIRLSSEMKLVECSAERFTIAPTSGDNPPSWTLENITLPDAPVHSTTTPVLTDLNNDGVRQESQILNCNHATTVDLRALISHIPRGRYELRYILRSITPSPAPPANLILSAGKPYDAKTFMHRLIDSYISPDIVPVLLYPNAARVRVTVEEWARRRAELEGGWFEVFGDVEVEVGMEGCVGVVLSRVVGEEGVTGGWSFGGVRLVPIRSSLIGVP